MEIWKANNFIDMKYDHISMWPMRMIVRDYMRLRKPKFNFSSSIHCCRAIELVTGENRVPAAEHDSWIILLHYPL